MNLWCLQCKLPLKVSWVQGYGRQPKTFPSCFWVSPGMVIFLFHFQLARFPPSRFLMLLIPKAGIYRCLTRHRNFGHSGVDKPWCQNWNCLHPWMLLSFSHIFFSKGHQTLHWYTGYRHRLLSTQPWLSLESISISFPVSIAGIRRQNSPTRSCP